MKNPSARSAPKGSPLVVLAGDGAIYRPISDQTPAGGQNAKPLPFARKRVSVTGKTYERGNARAIVVETFETEK